MFDLLLIFRCRNLVVNDYMCCQIRTGEVTLLDVIGLVIGMAISGWYAATGHWLGNNLIAAAVCIYGIEQMSVGSFRIGAVLLVSKWIVCYCPASLIRKIAFAITHRLVYFSMT